MSFICSQKGICQTINQPIKQTTPFVYTAKEVAKIVGLTQENKFLKNKIKRLDIEMLTLSVESSQWQLKHYDQVKINEFQKNISQSLVRTIDLKNDEIKGTNNVWKTKRNNAYVWGTSIGMALATLVAWLTGLIG